MSSTMKHAILSASSRRTRQALESKYSVSNSARFAALFVAGLALITVEIPGESMHVPLAARTHYQAFAIACPAFRGSPACFGGLNQGNWRKTLTVSWPWLLLLSTAVMALMVHPYWPLLGGMALSTILLDRVMLVRSRSKHLQA